MNRVIELKPTKLIAVEVPDDAVDIKILENGKFSYYVKFVFKFLFGHDFSKYKIVGEITKDYISIGVSDELIPTLTLEKEFPISYKAKFEDFINGGYNLTETESTVSLLKSNDLYFTNSQGYKSVRDKEWHEAEDKLIKGKLVILKLK